MKADVKQVVWRIETTLFSIKGVIGVLHLTDRDVRRILNLERNAEDRVLLDTPFFNAGVREVSRRGIVLAIAKTPEFPPAPAPTVLLVSHGQIVGEEVVDSEKVKQLRCCPEVVLIGEAFVIYRNRVKPNAGDSSFMFPPLPFPAIQQLDDVDEVVAASPMPPSDIYLKRKAGWDVSDTRIGTLLIGCNLRDSSIRNRLEKRRVRA